MLSTSDAKLVKRYYLLPKAAWYSLVALFLTGGLAILLVMIDNIGLGSKGFGDLQLIAMAAFMIAEGAVCVACGVIARRGLGSAHWQELEREAIGGNANIGTNPAVAGGIGVAAAGRLVDTLDNDDLDALSTGLEIAGAAMSAYGLFDTMRRMSRAAAAVARAHGMELPGLGRTRLLVIGLPLLLLTLSFVPRFIDSAAQSSEAQEASARAIQALNTALEPVCSYTLADDPLEHHQDSGYRVSGNITDEDGDIVASVSVETDERGAVDSVVYNADVDIARTPEGTSPLPKSVSLASMRQFPACTSRWRESSCWTRGSSTPPSCPRNSVRRSSPATITPPSTRTSTTPAPCALGPSSTRNRKRNSTSTPHRKSPST